MVKTIAGLATRPRHCAEGFEWPMGTMTWVATRADQVRIATQATPAAITALRFVVRPANSSSTSEPYGARAMPSMANDAARVATIEAEAVRTSSIVRSSHATVSAATGIRIASWLAEAPRAIDIGSI